MLILDQASSYVAIEMALEMGIFSSLSSNKSKSVLDLADVTCSDPVLLCTLPRDSILLHPSLTVSSPDPKTSRCYGRGFRDWPR